MSLTAIYTGTFDPITLGHVDVALRGAKLCDKLLIAVAETDRKKTLLSFEARSKLVKQVFEAHKNIEVHPLSGLLVQFAKEQGATILLRSVRSGVDTDYELQLAGMNRAMAPDIETVLLPSNAEFSHISSTIVREIWQVGGDLSPFVPKDVIDYLREHHGA